jgi:Tol biopolymer transport system component
MNSPDGTYLAAVYFRSGSSLIYKIPLDTGKATPFTKTNKAFEGVPSFSSDGRRIAYSYSAGKGKHSQIIISNIAGSDSHPWSISETNAFRPVFLPENKGIIFARSGYYGN